MDNNAEASGSDDDDDAVMDEMAAALVEAEGLAGAKASIEVDPEVERQQEIMAEVARRRQALNAAATKQKSDAIFERFDADRDGFLNYRELKNLGAATGGQLPRAAYTSICNEIGADPAKGVTRELLLLMYTDAGLGDACRDHNLIFNPS